MKKIVTLFILIMNITGVSKGINRDTIPCIELSARIEPGNKISSQKYSIELWAEVELISITTSDKNDVFRYELKKNVQYTILVFNGDSIVKKVFINTKTPTADLKNGQKMEVVLGFPDAGDCENKNCISATIDFDYDAREFLYKEGETDEGQLKNLRIKSY